jgi:hypothetical protein
VAACDAGNVDLDIHALCNTGYFAFWRGEAREGIDRAAAAQGLVGKTKDPLMRVQVALTACLAYAIDGRYAACMTEFEQAEAGLASAGRVSTESPLYYCHEGFLAARKSQLLLRLGKSREAAVSANVGLALLDKSSVGSYAVCALHLGNAHLQCGEIDEAARVVGSAAGLAAQTRSARLVQELCATRAQMQPWQDTQAVKVLDDQLAAYGLTARV